MRRPVLALALAMRSISIPCTTCTRTRTRTSCMPAPLPVVVLIRRPIRSFGYLAGVIARVMAVAVRVPGQTCLVFRSLFNLRGPGPVPCCAALRCSLISRSKLLMPMPMPMLEESWLVLVFGCSGWRAREEEHTATQRETAFTVVGLARIAWMGGGWS